MWDEEDTSPQSWDFSELGKNGDPKVLKFQSGPIIYEQAVIIRSPTIGIVESYVDGERKQNKKPYTIAG